MGSIVLVDREECGGSFVPFAEEECRREAQLDHLAIGGRKAAVTAEGWSDDYLSCRT